MVKGRDKQQTDENIPTTISESVKHIEIKLKK